MQKRIRDILAQVDAQRIANLTLALVNIPSPSGGETKATEYFSQYLREAGIEVQIDRSYPESPSIIAYVRGSSAGPTLQLDGHIDTVSTEHSPGEIRGGRVYGRGAADMKGNLAAMAEAAMILQGAGVDLTGSLMLTTHGQHEDAVGDNPLHATLLSLFEKNLYGDAVIVCEGPHDGMVIAGRGLCFWEIDIRRDGDPVHEVIAGGVTNPLVAANRLVMAMEEETSRWGLEPDLDVGPQSFFVGQIDGGDYYNRVPNHVHMKGTRRTTPGVSFKSMKADFEAIVDRTAAESNMQIDLKLIKSGQSYRLSPDEPIVAAVRKAYTSVVGEPLPLKGLRYTANGSQFINIAGAPAVLFGAKQHRAHANPEWVEIDELAKAAKVYLLSALNYLTDGASDD